MRRSLLRMLWSWTRKPTGVELVSVTEWGQARGDDGNMKVWWSGDSVDAVLLERSRIRTKLASLSKGEVPGEVHGGSGGDWFEEPLDELLEYLNI